MKMIKFPNKGIFSQVALIVVSVICISSQKVSNESPQPLELTKGSTGYLRVKEYITTPMKMNWYQGWKTQ